MTDPMASPDRWMHDALALDLSLRESPRSHFALPRLHYSSDLEPEACARRTFYSLRFEGKPLDDAANLTSWLGDVLEDKFLTALERNGKLTRHRDDPPVGRVIARQVKVKPLRPSAWCWEGTADALLETPEGKLAVAEVKSVEPEVADLLRETGRLDLAKRERHTWQLGAYKVALQEKLGPLEHRLIFLPRGDAPVVILTPELPTVDQIIAREIEVARLLPSAQDRLNSGYIVGDFRRLPIMKESTEPPARLELAKRPRKKNENGTPLQEIAPSCRWCAFRERCGVDEVAKKANEQKPFVPLPDLAPEKSVSLAVPAPTALGHTAETGAAPVSVVPPPAPRTAVKEPGAWDLDDEPTVEKDDAREAANLKLLAEDRKIVERIDKFGKNLSDNEVDFVISFLERLAGGQPLSDKQRKVAVDIDNRRVS